MKFRALLVVALFAGCAPSKPVALEFPPAPPPAVVKAAVIVRHPPETVAPGIATADAVIRDSNTFRDEAGRYVAWTKSRPANIDRLSTLTVAVTAAVNVLRSSRTHGRYGVPEVMAARIAVDALREFLAHKQD